MKSDQTSDVELVGHSSSIEATSGSSLLPADGGKDAWLFLAGSFVIEGLVWGFAQSFGIVQEYYSSQEPFAGSTNIATIGSTATGLMYLGLPFWFMVLLAFPRSRRISPVIGLLVLCGAILLSSFANTTTELLVTEGVLYAVGGCTTYAPTILFLDEWFIRKKGLAFGIMWAGAGTAGLVVPLAMEAALKTYGFRIALRGWALIVLVLTAPTLYFIKPRLPPSRVRRFHFSFLFAPDFMVFQLGNIIQGFGFFIPAIYPTYARQLGGSAMLATCTVVVFNVASVVGCICAGTLVDRCHVTTPIALWAVGSTVAIFLLWGLSGDLPLLFVFCITYGLFAGGFSATWPGIIRVVTQKTARAEPGLVFAFLAAGRGVGNVVSGPISEALLRGNAWHGAFGYGSGYGPVIVFTGATAILSGLAFLGNARKGLL